MSPAGAIRGLARAFARYPGLFTSPLRTFADIAESPDALGPLTLLMLSLALQLSLPLLLMEGMYLSRDGRTVPLASPSNVNMPSILIFRVASLFSLWFLSFLAYWFIMYLAGTEVEGFKVFSATGYLLSTQLAFFLLDAAVYHLASALSPRAVVVYREGVFPERFLGAILLSRFEAASGAVGVPLALVVEFSNTFPLAWALVLSVTMVRALTGFTWRRSAACGAAGYAALVALSTVFRSVGVL